MRSKKALKNMIALIVLQLVSVICGFIIPKILISTFGSSVNGLVTSITQFLSYITLLDLGVGAVVKASLYKPIAENNNREIENILATSERFFKMIAKIFLIYIVILVIVYPILVKEEFNYMFTISLIIIIAVSSFAEYYFGITYKLFLQADQKTYIISIIQIVTTILNVIIVVVLAKLGTNIIILKLFSGLIYIVRPIFQNIYVKKKYKIHLENADGNYKLEQKWDGLAQHIACVVHNNTDIAVLTIFSNVLEVSVYSVYSLVINGLKRLIEAICNGIDASFGNMIAKNEIDILNKNYNIYEIVYLSAITIIYSCTLVLIVPFVEVYTYGITDVNYIRPLFAFIIVLSEYIYAIRAPYNSLTLVAGHFKEMKKGAWIEAIINLSISIILVFKLGIMGVAIGTLIAMSIRAVEFINYASKKILNRKTLVAWKKISISIIEVVINVTISLVLIKNIEFSNYKIWVFYAIIVLSISIFITFLINFVFYRNERKELKEKLKKIIKRS